MAERRCYREAKREGTAGVGRVDTARASDSWAPDQLSASFSSAWDRVLSTCRYRCGLGLGKGPLAGSVL